MPAAQRMTSVFRIAAARTDDLSTVRILFREYAASADAPSCFANFERELAALPGDCAPPAGGIVLAQDAGGATVGVVAFHPLGPGIAEMKRLFVQPAARGQGLGRSLVQDVMQRARSSGHRVLRLSTVPRAMPAADALYRDLGFRSIPAYDGAAGAAACYEIAL